jgi:glycosyltransferase involved in cell wall biosynthesis
VTTVAVLSFRLGCPDGVSVVAESWRRALSELGFTTITVAGAGRADRVVPTLAFDGPEAPSPNELRDALDGVDLVVAENILSVPMNLDVSLVVAEVLRGRPTIVHHHDLPWQADRRPHTTELPVHDSAWRHVVINRRTEREMAQRGFDSVVIYNAFPTDGPQGDREATRRRLGVAPDAPLLIHPVRAIPRKNIPGALALAEATGATYWLPGPAEDGYAPILDSLLAATPVRVLRAPLRPEPQPRADAYAACDAVLFPSRWEGFGNPPIEAAIAGRPVAVGSYPIGRELAALGFRWLPADDPEPLRAVLQDPTSAIADLEHNREVALTHFAHDAMRERLGALVGDMGVRP